MKIGILHPGKMGKSLALACKRNGHEVYYASEKRSDVTCRNAKEAGAIDLVSVKRMCREVDVIFSICMGAGVFPNASEAVNNKFSGVFVDFNHIGNEGLESDLRSLLSQGNVKYVEGSIYGWPYPHENDPHGERTVYLNGEHASDIGHLLHGDVFDVQIGETSSKNRKRQREEENKSSNIPLANYGVGVVEFPNALADIDDSFVDEWMARRRACEPNDYYKDDEGYYISRGGYRFTESQILSAPERFMNLTPDGSPQEDVDFYNLLEETMFKCIHAYSMEYPEAKDTLWWRADGHLAAYKQGYYMGFHHDTAVGGASGNENPVFLTVSASLIVSDRCQGGALRFKHLDKEFLPIKGSVIMYPAGYMGTHAVDRVESGERISYLEFFGHGTRSDQTRRI